MRLSFSKSKNSTSLYVIKDVIKNNKRTTKIVEKLGTVKELEDKLNGQDPIEWAKDYIDKLNQKEEEQTQARRHLPRVGRYLCPRVYFR